MIAVGIDPSLVCTGLAILSDTDKPITRRIATASTGTDLRSKRDRIRKAIAGILAPIPARVDITVIEVPHSRQQFGAQNERIALYYFIVDQLLARGPVVEVAPSSRAKLATGSGQASKDEVVAAMRTMHPTAVIQDDNVADALALATAGARWAGMTFPYTPEQEIAHARLAWPTTRLTA